MDYRMRSAAQVVSQLKEEVLLHRADIYSWRLWDPCLQILCKPEELFRLDRCNNNGLPAICCVMDLLKEYGFSVEKSDVESLKTLMEILFKNCLEYDEEMPFPTPKRYELLSEGVLYTQSKFVPPYGFE